MLGGGVRGQLGASSTIMAKARDSCPITGLDIVLVSPRRIQRVGSLVRPAVLPGSCG